MLFFLNAEDKKTVMDFRMFSTKNDRFHPMRYRLSQNACNFAAIPYDECTEVSVYTAVPLSYSL